MTKNIEGSSNSSGNFWGMEKYSDGVLRAVQCRCGISAPCWKVWKDETPDPRRRLFGCSRFKTDPPYTERAKDVIQDLKMRLRGKDGELRILRQNLDVADSRIAKLIDEGDTSEMRYVEYVTKKEKELADYVMKEK